MHPALTNVNLTTPIALVSAALWCAATVTAMTVGPSKTNAPPATAANPFPVPDETSALTSIEQVSIAKADRLPLFDTRFTAAAPQLVPPTPPVDKAGQNSVPVALAAPDDPEPAARSVKPVKQIDRPGRHSRTGDICQRHNMHKVSTHGGRSWRCRR